MPIPEEEGGSTAGYVLAGGRSSRMGTNKALLRLGGRTLVEIAAGKVRQATGSVTIVGQPEIYGRLGFPVIPDQRSGAGPLAGIESALRHSRAEWNLVVACDMPGLAVETLQRICGEGLRDPAAGCILPQNADGMAEPLCALYHKRLLAAISAALDAGIRKITAALAGQAVHSLRMTGDGEFQNINTPEEWGALSA